MLILIADISPKITLYKYKLDYFTIGHRLFINLLFKKKKIYIFSLYILRQMIHLFLDYQLFFRLVKKIFYFIIYDLKHEDFFDKKRELYKMMENFHFMLKFFVNLLKIIKFCFITLLFNIANIHIL